MSDYTRSDRACNFINPERYAISSSHVLCHRRPEQSCREENNAGHEALRTCISVLEYPSAALRMVILRTSVLFLRLTAILESEDLMQVLMFTPQVNA